MKKSFLGSAWFPFLMCLVLAGVTVGSYAALKPAGTTSIDNSQMLMAMTIAGWAVGPVMGVLSLIVIGILNLIRRIVRLRKNTLLHVIVVLLGIGPWLVWSWVLLDEPRYTQLAIGVLDFVARPMLWGSLVATLLTIVLAIPSFFSKKK